MSKMHDHCKGKMICDATEPDLEVDGHPSPAPDALAKIGCGHVQPLIRKEGLKLFMVYKKSKDEDDQVCILVAFL